MQILNNIPKPQKPQPEQFGWHNNSGFDDEPSGWMYEGGEEAYLEALKKYQDLESTNIILDNL